MANQVLTASNIRYLLTMYDMEQEGNGTRCVRLASALGLSRPSVHNMVDRLTGLGLVQRSPDGTAVLSDCGRATAKRYRGYYDCVHHALCVAFSEPSDMQAGICALLSAFPEQELEKMCTVCPGGGRVQEKENSIDGDC